MDQQQFKVRMSVSTKLLLIISFLLITPIFFLNLSAITLFRNDKEVYVFDSQAIAVKLTGREFVSYLDNSLGVLKLIVGSTDLSKPLSEQSRAAIQFYLDNQRALLGTELYTINPADFSSQLAYQQFLPAELTAAGLDPQTKPHLPPEELKARSKELQTSGYFFKNISRPGEPPTLAVAFADISRIKTRGHLPVAVGYLSLQHFTKDSSSSVNRFLIADKTGALLFHSEIKWLYTNSNIANNTIFSEGWASQINQGAKKFMSPESTLTLGSYYRPGLDLIALSELDYEKAMEATFALTQKFIVLGLASLGFMIMLGLIFSKRLIAPLNRLFKATAQVSAGNFEIDLPITSRDEIGALTNSFIQMSKRISDLLQEMVDKVRVDQELEIAKTVQQSLFPPTVIENEHALIVSHYQSASECGGDWWGCFKTGNKHSLIIADATGHGLPSALMTASARSCFSVIEKLAADSKFGLNPSDMLSVANRVVYDSAQGKIMMTCFACVIDFDTHTITFASAAHNPPWLFSKQDGGGFKLSSLVATGQRLGELQEVESPYEVKQTTFNPQDTLVLYTDGLLEGKNLEGAQYGKKRSRTVLEDAIAHDPQTIINNLMNDFMSHNTGKPLDDDVTLAVVRFLA